MDRLRLIVERASLEVEQADREFEIAEFTRQIKASQHQAAEEKVQRHRITAPLSGMVVQVNRRRGEWVEPGEMVMRILRLDRLKVTAIDSLESAEQLRTALGLTPGGE